MHALAAFQPSFLRRKVANAGSDNTILRANTISSAGVGSADAAGIHLNGDASVGGDGLIRGVVIENNTVSGATQNGLSMDGVQDSVVQNNLVYGNSRNGLRAFRIDASAGPKNLRIVNNTFRVPSTSSGWVIAISEDLGGHVIFNNILLAEGSGGSIRLESSSISTFSDRNRVVDRFSVNGGSTILTLAQWRASGANRDPNSAVSSASALFVDAPANDYRPAATSPAIDAGVAALARVSAPASDIAGNARPQGSSFDIGAHEFFSSTDTTPPVVSGVTAASITSSGATISWTTNEAADSQVEYGTSTSYGLTTTHDSSLVTSHSQALSGLTAGTVYNYRVKSRDAAGNVAISANFTFTTAPSLPPPDTIPPAVSITAPLAGANVSGSTVMVSAPASDNVGIAGVQFKLDGVNLGTEDVSAPYSISWDTLQTTNGSHSLTALARDIAGNQTASVPVVINVSNTTSSTPSYSIPDAGAQSWTTTATTGDLRTSHIRVKPDTGTQPPSGVAIFSFRSGGVLVSEAGVQASEPLGTARIYAEANNFVKTGIAIANTADQDTVISFYFTDNSGIESGNGSFTLPANRQVAAFLDQAPFNGPAAIQGTFTFDSSVSLVSATALRGFTNERGEFLMTTVPVVPLGVGLGGRVMMFPHFADGGGWSTGVRLINPTNTALSGTIEFYNQGSKNRGAQPIRVLIGGSFTSTFNYVIPPRAGFRIATERSTDSTRVGSVRITANGNSPIPAGVAIFSYKNGQGITVSEASVPALSAGSIIRVYADSAGTAGQIGSLRTGLAISNPSASPVIVQLDLRNANGTPTGITTTLEVPANGQVSSFANELLPGMPSLFQGVLHLTADAPVVAVAIRGRYNERGDYLMTTIPATNAASAPGSGAEVGFPHVVSGGGYTTEIILFSGSPGSVRSGTLYLIGQDGTILSSQSLQRVP